MNTNLQKKPQRRMRVYRNGTGDTFDSPAGPLVLIVLIGMILTTLAKGYNQKLRENEPLSPEALKRIEAKVEQTKKHVEAFKLSEFGKAVNEYSLKTNKSTY